MISSWWIRQKDLHMRVLDTILCWMVAWSWIEISISVDGFSVDGMLKISIPLRSDEHI